MLIGGILSALKVVDLTQNVAGPFCTQILGDFGADVIKVERVGQGDDTRAWRPPELAGHSATYLALNRNKRSICVDFDTQEGLGVLRQLVGSADIFIHSMKPGSAEARGLGYEALSASNPELLYCAISGFGQVGPMRNLPGYDPLMQAFTGVMSVTGNEGDDPVRVGVSLIDMGTGMWAAMGVFAGLLQRAKTSRGMQIETSLLETGVSWMTVFVANYFATQKVPRKLGSAMAMTAPYELFPASDGHVFIAAGNDRLFRRVCEGLGIPGLADVERFATNSARVQNRNALKEEIGCVTATMLSETLLSRLRSVGAPCSELNDVSEMLASEQVQATDMIVPLPLENAPDHRVVAMPLKLNGRRSDVLQPPPELGADTDTILKEVGLSTTEIARLRCIGAVA
jgi:crotonobetainyl-CoA:carnitine CoA-transferase CaiB-like acyl-CoA transferase